MTTLTYSRPQVTRVDLAPPVQVSNAMNHPTRNSIPPFANALKTIAHYNHKPQVAAYRN